jgi:hypothetical protein
MCIVALMQTACLLEILYLAKCTNRGRRAYTILLNNAVKESEIGQACSCSR